MGDNTGEIQIGSERELYKYINTAVWPVRTANNAAIQAYTLLLYHHCCVYTYRCQCITPTKVSPPWPERAANITTEGAAF